MDLKSSKLMVEIAKLNKKPVVISGYVVTGEDRAKDQVRLYPRLDPRQYYAFDKDCVIGTQSSEVGKEGFVTLFLDPDCEVEVVCQERMPAKELTRKESKYPCGCADTTEDPDVILKEAKDDFRDTIIAIAKMFLNLGITEIDCTNMDSLGAGCCQAWNRLLGAVSSGGNTFEAANTVLAFCYGIG